MPEAGHVRQLPNDQADRARVSRVDDVTDAWPCGVSHDPGTTVGEDIVGVGVDRVRVLDEVCGVANVEALRKALDDVIEQRVAFAWRVRGLSS